MVALSTLQAEYIACSNATREAIWMNRLLDDIASLRRMKIDDLLCNMEREKKSTKKKRPKGYNNTGDLSEEAREPRTPAPVTIYTDNQGALRLIESGVVQTRSKHIDVVYHHSHDEQNAGRVAFEHIPSEDNVSDVMTKPLPRPRHSELTKKLNLA